ncbi:MAG: helix-turn-helix transcriptional regulator [Clostridiales bacterium]|nr:helix-turn-helix transcriptional regulator [Clostridiales bacterium]
MVIMSKFAETLSALMEEHTLNAPALAKLLKTDRTNITRYLRAERLPNYQDFVKLIEFFNVSADVLLGRMDYCNYQKFRPVQPFGTTLYHILNETKTTQYRVIKDLKISQATMYFWLRNNRLPTVENLDKLADYLDVTVDYLLGRIS